MTRIRETSALRAARVIVAVAYAVLCVRTVLAATLPNEIPGSEIAVVARGACGPFFRPGAWMTLRVTVENAGGPFEASVRVRETRGGQATYFVAAERVELKVGPNPFDVLVAPGDPSSGTALEIVRLAGGEDGNEIVFRSALSRILRPLARDERLVLAVGGTAARVRGGDRARVWTLEPGDMPATQEAYGSVDALVIGNAPRSAVSTAQVRAAASFVLGGGRIVFMSFRAMGAFAPVLFGSDARAPRDLEELRTTLPDIRIRAVIDAGPCVIEFPLGFGRCVVVARGPGELEKLLGGDGFLAHSRAGALVDAGAFGALEAERPFARAGMRARTIVIVGALIATLCAALVAGRRRGIAGGVLGGAAVAWAVVASVAWQEPIAAARIVRVRAWSADGRAEVVTDTAAFTAFDREATLAFETETGPLLPVARRPGRAFAEPFVLARRAGGTDAWSISSLSVYPKDPYLVRARTARAIGPVAETLRARVLAEGARVRVTTLPGGATKLSGADELPRDVRYLLERFAPPCDELAWVWVDGRTEGAQAPECDTAPGSGTLLIAGIPAAGESGGPPAQLWHNE